MTKILKYIGKGKGVIPGVPARDLNYKEMLAGGGYDFLIRSGLYERFEEDKPKRKYKSKKEIEEQESDE